MSDSPERIWYSQLMPTIYTSPDVPDYQKESTTEYIRADLYEDLEVVYSQQGNYKLLYEAQQLVLEMSENEQAKRIAELEGAINIAILLIEEGMDRSALNALSPPQEEQL